MSLLVVAIAAVLLVNQTQANFFKKLYHDEGKLLGVPVHADVGDPLILTTYIKEGRIEDGQQAARVEHSSLYGIESYAGYFTVDESYDANMWFWFFPSAGDVANDPVVIWLNGGPGATSLNGLFLENGPYYVHADGSVSLREYSWHLNHSIIFIDQPVSVGFSYSDKAGIPQNESLLGEHMHSTLTQFFQLFPHLQQNPFYISGESYAGKFLPAIGYTIMKKNPTADLKINLQGILIGNGWTDPINQVDYGSFLYNSGLISDNDRVKIDEYRDLAIASIQEEDWLTANYHCGEQLGLMMEASMVNFYNYIEDYDDPDTWINFVNNESVRQALHVGNIEFGDKGAAEAMIEDGTKTVAPWVEELLENYRVLIYAGQTDIGCGYKMIVDYIQKLQFSGAREYASATRMPWYVEGDLAGYVRTGGNLVELMIRDSGHMVPRDQPKWAYDLLYRFTRNEPYA